MPSYRRPYGGSYPRGTNSRPRGGPVVGATGDMSKYIPASQLLGMPSQSPRPVMDYTPPNYQPIPPNGESPQPTDNSIPAWMREGGPQQNPFSPPPVTMVPTTNMPKPLTPQPSLSAPQQTSPLQAGIHPPKEGDTMAGGTYVWRDNGWKATGPVQSPDSWMTDPTIGGSMNDPYVIAAQQNQQPTAPPQQVGYFGALGNAAAAALSSLAGPQMRQYGNQSSLDPRLTNWRTNV